MALYAKVSIVSNSCQLEGSLFRFCCQYRPDFWLYLQCKGVFV